MSAIERELGLVSRMRHDKKLHEFSQILKLPDVKSLMLKLIISNISNVADMNRSQLQRSKFYKIPESKFKLFEWRLSEFMERLLANEHYIDVHKFDDRRCLSIFKFLSDMSSLKKLLPEILNSSNRALDTLKDCLLNFTIEEDLRAELKKNANILDFEHKEFKQYVSFNQNAQKTREDNFNYIVDNCMDEVLVIDPMIMRTRTNYLEAHHESIESILQKEEEAVEKDISWYRSRLDVSRGIHEQAMAHIFIQIETLRHKVTYWSKKYEEEYEKYEFKNTNLKLTIKAMESNYETLQNRLQNFRIELAEIRNPSKKKPANYSKYNLPSSMGKRSKSPKSSGRKMRRNV